MTTPYTPLTTRYRPQSFEEVVGQEPTVTTLLQAVRSGRLGYAYLFSGSRGTGKTTLARLLAKALNCLNRNEKGEPCGSCTSCIEMASGTSLNLLEIDGASHRSIDDIRQIRETVGYAPAGGGTKIYLIDEVHMLTKEAFNALLKTLEEPPPYVKFLFATTEPHKLPATILSRCHHFPLRRISTSQIAKKLRAIALELSIEAEEEALLQIAQIADGGLRDAESLLDQLLSFHGDRLSIEAVSEILATSPQELFFRLDKALAEENLSDAFLIAEELFAGGRNIGYFIDRLIAHIRNLLLANLGVRTEEVEELPEEWKNHYREGSKLLHRDQWMLLLDELIQQRSQFATAPSQRIALETILLRVVRSRHEIPIAQLVRRLAELEKGGAPAPKAAPSQPGPKAPPAALLAPIEAAPQKQSRYDTMLRFAAVELEGSVKK